MCIFINKTTLTRYTLCIVIINYFGIAPCLVSFAIQYVRTSLEFQTFKISKIDFLISSNFKIRISTLILEFLTLKWIFRT